jgi:hypothetical protein
MKKFFIAFVMIMLIGNLISCAGAHLTGGVGMSFGGGPYGFGMQPTFNIGISSGGYHW